MYKNEDWPLLACNISFWKWSQLLKQICRRFSTQPHGVISHKTIIFTLTVMRTSHFSLIIFKQVGILWNFQNVQFSKITLCCVLYINYSKYNPVKQNYFCYKHNAVFTKLHCMFRLIGWPYGWQHVANLCKFSIVVIIRIVLFDWILFKIIKLRIYIYKHVCKFSSMA